MLTVLEEAGKLPCMIRTDLFHGDHNAADKVMIQIATEFAKGGMDKKGCYKKSDQILRNLGLGRVRKPAGKAAASTATASTGASTDTTNATASGSTSTDTNSAAPATTLAADQVEKKAQTHKRQGQEQALAAGFSTMRMRRSTRGSTTADSSFESVWGRATQAEAKVATRKRGRNADSHPTTDEVLEGAGGKALGVAPNACAAACLDEWMCSLCVVAVLVSTRPVATDTSRTYVQVDHAWLLEQTQT